MSDKQWLIYYLIGAGSFTFGFFMCALFVVASRSEKRLPK